MISSIHLSLLILLADTKATQALTITPRDSSSSQTLPLSVIIGISIAVIAIFALATTLFVIYFARQAPSSPFLHQQRRYYRHEFVVSPKDLVEPWSYVVNNNSANRSPLHGGGVVVGGGGGVVVGGGGGVVVEVDGKGATTTAAAKPPARFSIIQLTHDPRSAVHGPDNAMPAHHAYDPNTVSRSPNHLQGGSSSSTSAGPLSPPQPAHRLRPSTPDSFIIQSYKSVVEDAARQSSSNNRQSLPSPAAAATLPSPPEPSPSLPTGGTTRRASSLWSSRLSSLSLPKIQLPRRNRPPRLNLLALQPLAMGKGTAADGEMHITPPLLNDPRFVDRPLGAGVVVIERNPLPSPDDAEKYAAYTEVPLPSGKSELYGM
ncbi:hypothetical protein BBK36DRAFT_1114527 [Trichoderma citrinoviride]|uniref:Uncharacterized protein n=1 Tax=Trichoderma citrinoviride TaxID=58853 RepID=A0A2T4BF42_9HYPO|nr:hypothetical protein BBK36DRAFT_1114527 [Trichoderma citrinoviride]PTB67953.1 hypothetical protein BBK36DRAFT_1114527 [Trichoderma citrinoviride]